MALSNTFAAVAPAREEIDALKERTVLEFGTPWCGYCLGAQPLIASAFSAFPQVGHIKVEDGPGRRLGRSFKIELWPTLIFLRDGQEVARLVRPGDADEIRRALAQIASAS